MFYIFEYHRAVDPNFFNTLAHRNVVAAYNLGDGATFWKLFLALIGDNICSVYNYQ